jgi:hypothetical protein
MFGLWHRKERPPGLPAQRSLSVRFEAQVQALPRCGGATQIHPHEIRTPGQRRRFKRNIVITVVVQVGLSAKLVADAFRMSRRQVVNIVREISADANSVRTRLNGLTRRDLLKNRQGRAPEYRTRARHGSRAVRPETDAGDEAE